MAGCCWRLLAVFSLIFVVPVLLSGQDDGAVRFRDSSPAAPPHQSPLPYSSQIAPLGIPPPILPRRIPVAPGPIGLQQSAFQQLVQASGIIFSGRVTFVGHGAPFSGPNHSCTTVTFQVEHATRGASAGQNLTIHEWSGLWGRGERYRLGERVLLFLYAPSKLGLTSPVGGTMGKYALDSQGRIVMSPQQVPVFAPDPILKGKTLVLYPDFALAMRRVQQRGINEP